jgi:hypothetical protein
MTVKKRKTKAQVKRELASEERLAKVEPSIKPLAKWHEVGVLDTTEEYQEAGKAYNSITTMLDQIDADRKEITRHFDEGKRLVMAKYEPSISALSKLKQHVVKLLISYDDIARAKELARNERRAREAEKRGEKALAITLRETDTYESQPNAHVALPGTWKGQVTSIKDLCAGIASGDLPETLISVKDAELNRLARMYKEDLAKRYPGLKAELVKQVRRK